jgi:hypothetical protein
MSQDISSDQDALAQKSDTSSVSTENQTQSSDLSNNNLTQEGQLQVIRKEIDENEASPLQAAGYQNQKRLSC